MSSLDARLNPEKIYKDIKYLRSNKQLKDSRDGTIAFILHSRTSRERRKYTKLKGKWVFCGILSLEEVANFYTEDKK